MMTSDLRVSTLMCVVIAVLCWGAGTLVSFPLRETEATRMPTRQVDALVVLAGEHERWTYAQALLAQGHAPRLLSTLYDPICLRVGQPLDACPTGVRNTVDEAVTMRRILVREHLHRATIVTSKYHAFRTAAIFVVVFAGSGIDLDVVGAPSLNLFRSQLLLRELPKLGPSVAGAIVVRLSPPLYELLVGRREP